METPSKHIATLNQMTEQEYQKNIVQKMGYDPKTNMRINKLEKMCQLMSSKNMYKDGNRVGIGNMKEEDREFFFKILPDIKPIMFRMTEDMRDVVIGKDNIDELPIDIHLQTFSIDDWHSFYTQKDDAGMLNSTLLVVHELKPEHLILYVLYNFIPNDHRLPFEFVEKQDFYFKAEHQQKWEPRLLKLMPLTRNFIAELFVHIAKTTFQLVTTVNSLGKAQRKRLEPNGR